MKVDTSKNTNAKILKLLIVFAILLCAVVVKYNTTHAAGTEKLNISMEVVDQAFDISAQTPCNFDIELKDENGAGVNGEFSYSGDESGTITFTDGKGSLILHGQSSSITIDGLSEGWTYSVNLKTTGCWYNASSSSNTTGTITTTAPTANFGCTVNTMDQHILAFIDYPDKLEWTFRYYINFTSNAPRPKTNKFQYTGYQTGEIEIPDNPIISVEHNFQIKDGEEILIRNLPYNRTQTFATRYGTNLSCSSYQYTNTGEYALFEDSDDVTFIGTSGVTAETLILTAGPQSFQPKTFVKGLTSANCETDKEFTFKITAKIPSKVDSTKFYPVTGNRPYTIMGLDTTPISTGTFSFDENGVAYVKLKGNLMMQLGEFATERSAYYFTGITRNDVQNGGAAFYVTEHAGFERDTIITIEEVDNDGYTATTQDYGDTIFIMNARNFTGSLTVQKALKGEEADPEKEFKFKIKFEDGAPAVADFIKDHIYYTKGTTSEKLEFNDNLEAEFTLKGEESISITSDSAEYNNKLPAGMKYTITEEDYSEEGYTTTSENATGKLLDGEETIVKFTNSTEVEDPEEDPEEEEAKPEEEQQEEKKQESKKGPLTGDMIILSVIILVIGIAGIAFVIKHKKSDK